MYAISRCRREANKNHILSLVYTLQDTVTHCRGPNALKSLLQSVIVRCSVLQCDSDPQEDRWNECNVESQQFNLPQTNMVTLTRETTSPWRGAGRKQFKIQCSGRVETVNCGTHQKHRKISIITRIVM